MGEIMGELFVSQIGIRPFKGGRTVKIPPNDTLKCMLVHASGPYLDHRWMAVDQAGKSFSQVKYPKLATIQPIMEREILKLFAPGIPPIEISRAIDEHALEDVFMEKELCKGIDQGDEIAEWMSQLLGSPARVVRIPRGGRLRDSSTLGRQIKVNFTWYPFHMVTEASLTAINSHLSDPVPMDRLRPTLVIANAEPYEEDSWRVLQIGNTFFDYVKKTDRCGVVNVDEETGTKDDGRLLTALGEHRRVGNKVFLGSNFVHHGTGTICVGDTVKVLEADR